MKKLLNLLTVTSLITSISMTTIACGNRGLSTTITYGIVDNGEDNLSEEDWKELEEKYYSLYGKKYKLEAVKEIGDNELPEKILKIGANVGPDMYTASVDLVSKLATSNAILALTGKDAPPFMQKIIDDLNYNVDHANKVLKKPIKERTSEEEWGTFLPYAIESSNLINNNELSQNEGRRAQYGITRALGVSGGSAVLKKDLGNVLNDVGFEYAEDGKSIEPVGETTLKEMIDYSAAGSKENFKKETKANEIIPMLIDRGMWEMYPFYSNIISTNETTDGKIYKASEIGVNWINAPYLPYYNSNEAKYSSVFSNPYFLPSTKEILIAFFNYYAQLYKVALNKLSGQGSYNKAENLLNPEENVHIQVQKTMLKNNLAASTTATPSIYTSFITSVERFQNMQFVDMTSIKIFDSKTEPDLAQKYEKEKLNSWMPPAISNMIVFSRKLGTNKEKALAAIRWAELSLGFREENGKVTSDGTGGIFNLEKGFLNANSVPSKIAINNEEWTKDPTFIKAIETTKVPRRVRVAQKVDYNYVQRYNENPKGENQAIVELEKYSIDLASRLYNSEEANLTLAPNVTTYDPATKGDWHGKNAMRPNLENAFKLTKIEFEKIYGSFNEAIQFDSKTFVNQRNDFINKFLDSMQRLNKEMGN